MSEQYTPGELSVEEEYGAEIVSFEDGHIVDVATVYCHAIDGRTEANAERLVACWNACQGIDTADMKAGSVSIIHKLHDEAAKRVLAQRDEPLAALNLLKAADFGANVITAEDERHMDSVAAFARSAIAKVEGGAK